MSQSESEIVIQLGQPSKRGQAFSAVVRLYQERLYWHIRKMVLSHEDANDVLQNTFLKAWKALDSFRGDSQLSTWLYRIATNESINFLNGKKKRNFVFLDQVEHRLSNSLESDPYFNGSALEQALAANDVTGLRKLVKEGT